MHLNKITFWAKCLLFAALPACLSAQPVLTLEQAVGKTLAANKQLQIQAQYIRVAENRVDKALTGQMPVVDAVATGTYTNNWTDIALRTFQPEPPIVNLTEWGVESWTANAGLEARYTLFDGGQGRLRYQLFEGLSEIERNKQAVIANELATAVVNLYFEILKLQNRQQVLLESIAVNEERERKLRDKAEFGKVNNLALLQAQTSINQDRSALQSLVLAESQLLIDLKELMEDDAEASYVLAPLERLPSVPAREQVYASILQKNPQLKLAKSGISVSDLKIEQTRVAGRPTLAAFANVGYFYQKNDVQQLARIENVGGTIGLTARYNLYDGGAKRINAENAVMERNASLVAYEQLQQSLEAKARRELLTIQKMNELLELERSNLTVYEAAYQKASDQNAMGQVPEFTLREAQLAVIGSKALLSDLEADLQRAIELLYLIAEGVDLGQ